MLTNKYIDISMLLICLISLFNIEPVYAQSEKDSVISIVKIFSEQKDVNHFVLDKTQLVAIEGLIDYSTMAQYAIGKNNWTKLSNSQRIIYVNDFKSLLEHRYYPRWHKIFAKSTFSCGSDVHQGQNILVNSTITTGEKTEHITWTLTGQPAKVIDLTVDENDLLKRLQTRFQKKLASGDIPAFISWLDKACKQLADKNEQNSLSASKTSDIAH